MERMIKDAEENHRETHNAGSEQRVAEYRKFAHFLRSAEVRQFLYGDMKRGRT
jgi:hypothetical protein